jgi:hypothetical protein
MPVVERAKLQLSADISRSPCNVNRHERLIVRWSPETSLRSVGTVVFLGVRRVGAPPPVDADGERRRGRSTSSISRRAALRSPRRRDLVRSRLWLRIALEKLAHGFLHRRHALSRPEHHLSNQLRRDLGVGERNLAGGDGAVDERAREDLRSSLRRRTLGCSGPDGRGNGRNVDGRLERRARASLSPRLLSSAGRHAIFS